MNTIPSAQPAAMSRFAIWWAAVRPKTLWAALAPVLMGTAMAFEAGVFHPVSAVLALVGAICIQIGTNLYNDYADFLKGADTEARKGPVRVTQAGLVRPEAIRLAAYLTFVFAVVAGGYLMWRGGLPVVIIGVASVVSGILYTAGRYSLAYLGLGDLFVLIFFGPVAVGGTYYVQALAIDPLVLQAGLAPGLLAVAILLVNNVRDVEEDRLAAKRTLVVRLGRRFGVGLYGVCLVAAALIPIWLAVATGGHWPVLLCSAVALAGLPMVGRLGRERAPAILNPMLGATARLLLLYSIVFAVGWNV
ncbi:MAG: 1,4-dihydroxy-2-naphthoate polyprenyltransferase [Rhodothermales bacterium]